MQIKGRLIALLALIYPIIAGCHPLSHIGDLGYWINTNGDPRMPGVDVIRWIEDIPFLETRGYVQRVLENAVVYDTLNPAQQSSNLRLSYYLGKTSRPG